MELVCCISCGNGNECRKRVRSAGRLMTMSWSNEEHGGAEREEAATLLCVGITGLAAHAPVSPDYSLSHCLLWEQQSMSGTVSSHSISFKSKTPKLIMG